MTDFILVVFLLNITFTHLGQGVINASLSDACKRYLGKPLSKINRLSDWQARPLTKSQLHYASLDAHSLIGIFDALLLEKNLDCGLKVAINQYNVEDLIAENRILISNFPVKRQSRK
jgi:hypothetical protein